MTNVDDITPGNLVYFEQFSELLWYVISVEPAGMSELSGVSLVKITWLNERGQVLTCKYVRSSNLFFTRI